MKKSITVAINMLYNMIFFRNDRSLISLQQIKFVLIHLLQSGIVMTTDRESANKLCSIIECNDIARCRAFLLPLSKKDKYDLVNTNIGSTMHPKTPGHLATDEDVDIDIWKIMIPWLYESTVCKGLEPLFMRLIYKYSDQVDDSLFRSFTLRRQQLEKLRFWLEHTKNSTSKLVKCCKTETLARLCRIKGSADPDKASLEEVRNLAKDMIETYNTRICLKDAKECPIHFAMETDNICFLSLFLSYETADANCMLQTGRTPLLARHFRRRSFYLPCIGLLLEHGAWLGYEGNEYIKAFHVVLLQQTPKELYTFMNKYHRLLRNVAEDYNFLPLFHGLIFHAEEMSGHENDRQIIESDILSKFQILLKYDMKLDTRDIHGRTVMHYSCWFKYPTIFEYLLSLGIKPDITDNFGRGCLYYAISQPVNYYIKYVKGDHFDRMLETVVKSLGDKVADIADSMGRSALHIVCFENNRMALECLIKAGFKMSVVDHQGKTPVDYASEEFIDIINKLPTKSQDTNSRNRDKVLHANQPYPKRRENEQGKLTTDVEGIECGLLHCNINTQDTRIEPLKCSSATKTSRNKTSESFLNDPQFGVLNGGDTTYIKKDVQRLIDKLANELEKIEPRFKSKVHLAGSVSEGTKLKPPNEFDFQFHLMYISQCFVVNELNSENDVNLAIQPSSDCDPLIRDMMLPGVSVNVALFNAFHSAAFKAIRHASFWKDVPFYWHHHNLMAVTAPEHGKAISKGTPTTPFQLKWVGLQQGDLDISVDLVPILVLDCLPDSVLALIPDRITEYVDKANFKWHIVLRKSKNGRLSFFPIEKYILCRLMPELRQSYKMAKAICKYCCETYGIHPEIITSYMLKNALFYELDPNLSFGLVTSQIMVYKPVNQCHTNVLSSMKETLEGIIADTGPSFIQAWTWKIFDRLERWFSSGDRVHVYCRPSAMFPSIMIVEFEHENPQVKSLQKFKEILERPESKYHHDNMPM